MSAQLENFLTIGSKRSRRVKFWNDTLLQKDCKFELLTYEQILKGNFPKITAPTTLRITSPGENFDLQKQILLLGGCPLSEEINFEKGEIYPNQYWYRGWCLLLEKITNFIAKNPLLKPINTPVGIKLAFHKLKCSEFLSDRQIRTPKIILNKVLNYDQLIETLQKQHISQVFIKPYHGSSASGVMAFRQAKGKQVLYSTIDLKSNKLYNNLRLQRYTTSEKIKTIINAMAPAGLLAEAWIPKKTFQGKSVDFRVLVINGKAVFVVPRMSNGCITNLHLGNEKGNIDLVEKAWGKSTIESATFLAEQAVKAISNLFYAGVDVAISTNGTPYILEINAFGDMLLNIFKEGKTTYEMELKEWSKQL